MRLYHYTKLENITSIIQKDKLSFWLTDYRELDDPTEGEYIMKIQRQYYPDWTHNSIERYVLSLCKRYDSLPMWKEYANNATGVVLEIETENIKPSSFHILLSCDYDQEIVKERSEVIKKKKEKYETPDVKQSFKDYCQRYPRLDPKELLFFFEKSDILDACVELIRVKHPCYSYEEEYRYIIKAWNDSFHYCFKNGKLRSCYEFNIENNALTKLYVGPNNPKEIIYEVKKYLQFIGYKDTEVQMVDLPYRNI